MIKNHLLHCGLTFYIGKIWAHAIVVYLPSSLTGVQVRQKRAGWGAVGRSQREIPQHLQRLPAELMELWVLHEQALHMVNRLQTLWGEDVAITLPLSHEHQLDPPQSLGLHVVIGGKPAPPNEWQSGISIQWHLVLVLLLLLGSVI